MDIEASSASRECGERDQGVEERLFAVADALSGIPCQSGVVSLGGDRQRPVLCDQIVVPAGEVGGAPGEDGSLETNPDWGRAGASCPSDGVEDNAASSLVSGLGPAAKDGLRLCVVDVKERRGGAQGAVTGLPENAIGG